MTDAPIESLDLAALRGLYRDGLSPCAVVEEVLARADAADDRIWISRVAPDALRARAAALETADRALPLYGVPFAVKDNIDVAGMETTAGCPAFVYAANETAPVVQCLLDAGAILVGKTNLDQFATGLVGTRSPYGVPSNPFDADYIPGGSSSGSAVAVARGIVSFALGTDTAGSGRVPAAFNNIVGLKPSRGLLSMRGVVPACRSLDCVSIFALTVPDAEAILSVAEAFDAEDPFSRARGEAPRTDGPLRIGVPPSNQLDFFGNEDAAAQFAAASARIVALGAETVEIDLEPFLAAARLLYEGPWVAERFVAIRRLIETAPFALLPITRAIIEGGAKHGATDLFEATYRLAELRRDCETAWRRADLLLLPTAGTIYRLAEIDAEPVALNANLGRYTNFMNLLDLCGLAVPAGFLGSGLPFGVTLVGRACDEARLCRFGAALHRSANVPMGATGRALPSAGPDTVPMAECEDALRIAVCGAHMTGLPLNGQLTELGGRFVARAATAPVYRMYALPAPQPPRPGMVRTGPGGRSLALEVWDLPTDRVGRFLEGVPAPLAIGTIQLDDGSDVKGFLCEPHAVSSATDISEFGGWRAYLAAGRRAG